MISCIGWVISLEPHNFSHLQYYFIRTNHYDLITYRGRRVGFSGQYRPYFSGKDMPFSKWGGTYAAANLKVPPQGKKYHSLQCERWSPCAKH